jgi:AcrR family transcriptional regulator
VVYPDRSLSVVATRWCRTFSSLPPDLVARYVAFFCSRCTHVHLLDCATCLAVARSREGAIVVRRFVAGSSAYVNGNVLGPNSGDDGHTRRHVDSEVRSINEYSLAEGGVLFCVRGADDLDLNQNLTQNAASRIVRARSTRSRKAGKNRRTAAAAYAAASQSQVKDRPRSLEIVHAAYLLIAEKGFEGLRTRDIAERVGINSATLHYYFPDKQALVQGVVVYLINELSRPRISVAAAASALEKLRAEFSDIKARLRQEPEQLIVLTELAVRGYRDATVARMLRRLDEGWHSHLVSIFSSGIEEQVFRKDLDVATAANLLMNQLRGLGYQGRADLRKVEQLVDAIALQTEHFVRR